MDRRSFIASSGAAGAASMILGTITASATDDPSREFYDLREFHFDSAEQKAEFIEFLGAVAIPALNRIGIDPVGAFERVEGFTPAYLLLPYESLESFSTASHRLVADAGFARATAAPADAPPAKPAYREAVSSLLHAFEGMPRLERPTSAPGRIMQLRIYENPSGQACQKKIEMFHKRELDIFRKVGLNPVFFAEAIAGPRLPNITYMLAFDSMNEMNAAWRRFGQDPDWKKLRAIPEYSDDRLIRKITNVNLKPMASSQI